MALKDIPAQFVPDSEEDLRHAVACYFKELGFQADEISFEDRFTIRLGHNAVVVDRDQQRDEAAGRSDILLTRDGHSLAIVETKSPDHDLTDSDAEQAISYARLLREVAPYTILTNGHETRVFDTLSPELTPIEEPTDALWERNNRALVGLTDDLRFQAMQILIGVNEYTLRSFCMFQVNNTLEGLKGTRNEGAFYIPEVYVANASVTDSFADWLNTDLPCFAVAGESGIGKTNFICATAEEYASRSFALFYSASRLHDGLRASIVNDFVWEFRRNSHIAHIIERLSEVVSHHDQTLVIFIDGLDEYPGNRDEFKAELTDFVSRLRGRSIRVCVSCKAFDWSNFVIDKGQMYNQLARLIYPRREIVHNPTQPFKPVGENVGIWLSEWDEEELENAFERYRIEFSLNGELGGNTRAECHLPLMMRFVADAYGGLDVHLPYEITSRDVFDNYWARRIGLVDAERAAEQILIGLANMCVETGERQILVNDLQERLPWTDNIDGAYRELARIGMVKEIFDENGLRKVFFGFEKMRSYTYTLRARRWPARPATEVASEICDIVSSLLGVEAVEFYLMIIDRGATSVLTNLAAEHFDYFVRLIESLDTRSSLEDVPEQQRGELLGNRLVQYALAYSGIVRGKFVEVSERISPNIPNELGIGEIGVWVHNSTYGLRMRNERYPQPILELPGEVVQGIMRNSLSPEIKMDLLCGSTIYWGMHDLVRSLPQAVAWQRIQEDVSSLFRDQFLDESDARFILEERIWDVLLYKPDMWFQGEENIRARLIEQYGRAGFMEHLGYGAEVDICNTTIAELLRVVRELQEYYAGLVPRNIRLGNLDSQQRGAYHKARDLLRLYYWLILLGELQERVSPQLLRREEIFSYLEQRRFDLTRAVHVLEVLLPKIIESFRIVAETNFPAFYDEFALARFRDSPVLAEVTRHRHGGDFLNVCYAILPNADMPQLFTVVANEADDSLLQTELQREVLKGSVTWSGFGFGGASISKVLPDGTEVNEDNAFLYFTGFPNTLPISDQVYQMLSIEMKEVVRAEGRHWRGDDHPRLNKDRLGRQIDLELRRRIHR